MVLLAVACASAQAYSGNDPAMQKTAADQYAAGTRILFRLAEKERTKNVVFSPLSFYAAAAMAANGMTGEPAEKLMELLGAADAESLNSAAKTLLSTVPALDPRVSLEIANGVWIASDCRVNPDLKGIWKDDYFAEVQSVNYGKKNVGGIINGWVKKRTRGLIPSLFPPHTHLDGPVTLASALYMKAPWTKPFERSATFEGVFHSGAGDVRADFMHKPNARAHYAEGYLGQMLTLPFGAGEYAITLVLPRPGKDINLWSKVVTAKDVMKFVKGGSSRKGEIILPRFSVEGTVELIDILKEMGCSEIFAPYAAPGSPASSDPFKVKDMVQKVKFKINEEGGEGGAVTGVDIVAYGTDDGPFVFKADRPFMFIVSERHYGTPLFMGIVRHP